MDTLKKEEKEINACIKWAIHQRDLLWFREIKRSKILGMSASLCQVLGNISKNQINGLKFLMKAQKSCLLRVLKLGKCSAI